MMKLFFKENNPIISNIYKAKSPAIANSDENLFFNFIKIKDSSELLEKKRLRLLTSKKIATCVRIKFAFNNIFCTAWSISGKKTFRIYSAGMSKIKISKKKLFFYSKTIIAFFLKELRIWKKQQKQKGAKFFYSLQVPKKYRKYIIKEIYLHAHAINIEYKKSFNGCKAKKKRRKKRLRFRNFK